MNAIEIRNVKKSFQGKRNQKTVEAVKGISLSVKPGEIFGFLGPNGAGKTTSLRMLTTLLPIDEGEAKIGEYDVKRNPREVRKHIGYVGQLGGADIEATGRENLMLSGRLYGIAKKAVQKQSELLMDLLDLRDIIDRLVKTYSGGQRRRLEIALGILHKPDVLFLDEPTTGLDPQNRANLWEHIRRLKSAGMTVFLTTHYLEEADELCDRLCIMDKGIIVAEGTPQILKREISGDVVSIKPKNNQGDLAYMFDDEEDVLDIRIEGGKTSLYVKDGAIAMPKIFNVLKGRGVELESVSLSQPSLDDVFLKQTGKSLRDTGMEASL
ncbi:MAG: ATP-binding cassette domain-containing protein [Anaerocolumna aminovalerica]|uniref:ATP-binding cassette domain-containing protein n=1 Tax=Anaerocolumna aminovalerica TaxID=1527 RepID=UPI00290883B3|nr:ATP-binding cassette domain-containing protein [Anaerocolumna aminovalerica]MDU6266145.1 ATP-binding cassette domain-containing protein [Anaerocolumna aminovalerica]